VALINNQNTLLYISIHANTFPSSNVFGSQVFYKDNELNKILSETIQEYLRLVDNNKRFAKSISGKYILDYTKKTGCLVEIGFLSNEQDYNNLCNNLYLENLAKHIYLGTIDFLNKCSKQGE
jgi:N-acetylmuramoyl-L-alanine amidase